MPRHTRGMCVHVLIQDAAPKIQKHCIVQARRLSGSVLDKNMHAHYTGMPGAPSLHVRACKAGGELTLDACQVAWGGRPILTPHRRTARTAARATLRRERRVKAFLSCCLSWPFGMH